MPEGAMVNNMRGGRVNRAADGDPALHSASWRDRTLAPFRHRIFLAIWLASLVSNFGSLIQAVGASWLMTSIAPSPDMVALVQAATALPIMLLSLPSGAVSDIHDRRSIMLVALGLMIAVSSLLAALAILDLVGAWTLLAMTFLLGCGSALYGPAWQSSVGEQVPRSELPAAVALNSLGFNIARTVGPAAGGVIVASAGPEAAFVVNAVSYIALIVVLASWRRVRTPAVLPPETLSNAMFAGLRYVGLSPSIRNVLIRSFAFGLAASGVWALMPLIARDLVGGGALTYGLLLGAFGIGAVGGALSAAPLHHRLSIETLVRAATALFGIAAAIAAMSKSLPLTLAALLVGGAAWVLALSTFNVTVQTCSPRWVVGRSVAVYQMVTFGGIAIGSWAWGEFADGVTLEASLLGSASLMGISVLLGLRLRLPQWEPLNLDPSHAWPDPQVRLDLVPQSGPVVVTVEYRVAAEEQEAFVVAMRELRRIRRRDGARRWTLLQDVADPDVWIERFHSPTWAEHLRHHHRATVADREVERRVRAFHRGAEPPRIRHLLERPPTAPPRSRRAESDSGGAHAAATDPNLPR